MTYKEIKFCILVMNRFHAVDSRDRVVHSMKVLRGWVNELEQRGIEAFKQYNRTHHLGVTLYR